MIKFFSITNAQIGEGFITASDYVVLNLQFSLKNTVIVVEGAESQIYQWANRHRLTELSREQSALAIRTYEVKSKNLEEGNFYLERSGTAITYSDFDFSDTSTFEVAEKRILSVVNKGTSDVTLSQSITTARPRTGVKSQNGLNVAAFDGLEFLNFSTNALLSGEFTIFLVGQSNATSSRQVFMGRYHDAVSAGQWVLARNVGFNRFFTQAYSATSSSRAVNIANNAANIHCIQFKEGEAISYIMGSATKQVGTPLNGYSNTTAGLALGAANNEGFLPLNGWIGQVLIYEKILIDVEIRKISTLLFEKWSNS